LVPDRADFPDRLSMPHELDSEFQDGRSKYCLRPGCRM
jgi:hypothetical protein